VAVEVPALCSEGARATKINDFWIDCKRGKGQRKLNTGATKPGNSLQVNGSIDSQSL
jgi:hypothetical protein